MPIFETLGVAIFACAVPVLLLQQFELHRLGRTRTRRNAGTVDEARQA